MEEVPPYEVHNNCFEVSQRIRNWILCSGAPVNIQHCHENNYSVRLQELPGHVASASSHSNIYVYQCDC